MDLVVLIAVKQKDTFAAKAVNVFKELPPRWNTLFFPCIINWYRCIFYPFKHILIDEKLYLFYQSMIVFSIHKFCTGKNTLKPKRKALYFVCSIWQIINIFNQKCTLGNPNQQTKGLCRWSHLTFTDYKIKFSTHQQQFKILKSSIHTILGNELPCQILEKKI